MKPKVKPVEDQVVKVHDATIPMHPHPTGSRDFVCYCGAYHLWGEKGTRTFKIPHERYRAYGWQMILCPCKIWHMKAIEAGRADNFIKEEKDADVY